MVIGKKTWANISTSGEAAVMEWEKIERDFRFFIKRMLSYNYIILFKALKFKLMK